MANYSKLIRAIDSKFNHRDLNAEEVVSNNFNKWKGWYCAAGSYSLYIDYDGNVFTCNNASSKLDRFNYDGWKKEKKRLKEDEGLNLETEENVKSGLYRKVQIKFEKSGDGFGNLLDANDKENYDKYFGFLGNIFQGFELKQEAVVCPYDQCGCGADIPIPKSITKNVQHMVNSSLQTLLDRPQDHEHELQKIVSIFPNDFPRPFILWDLSRRCNFDCSYCWPAVHNTKEAHKEKEAIINTCNEIIKNLSPNYKKVFCFSGGEPTLHPDILEILRHIKNTGHNVLITTNGSLAPDKWQELTQYIDCVQMSAHFEFLNQDRFRKNIEHTLKSILDKSDGRTIDVKLMTLPGKLDQSLNLKEQIEALPLWKEVQASEFANAILSLVPIRSIENSEVLLDYKETEIESFQSQ